MTTPTKRSPHLLAFARMIDADKATSRFTNRQLQALAHICEPREDKGITMLALAADMKADRTWLTRVIDALVERGLVVREENNMDRRVHFLVPTRVGRDLNDRVAAIYKEAAPRSRSRAKAA